MLRKERWPIGVQCPFCDSYKIITIEKYQTSFLRYKCLACSSEKGSRVSFNDKTGTIFEGSKINLRKWYYALKLFQKKISSHEISLELSVNKNTADRMLTLFRAAIQSELIMHHLKYLK
jgi:transposase-like protein